MLGGLSTQDRTVVALVIQTHRNTDMSSSIQWSRRGRISGLVTVNSGMEQSLLDYTGYYYQTGEHKWWNTQYGIETVDTRLKSGMKERPAHLSRRTRSTRERFLATNLTEDCSTIILIPGITELGYRPMIYA